MPSFNSSILKRVKESQSFTYWLFTSGSLIPRRSSGIQIKRKGKGFPCSRSWFNSNRFYLTIFSWLASGCGLARKLYPKWNNGLLPLSLTIGEKWHGSWWDCLHKSQFDWGLPSWNLQWFHAKSGGFISLCPYQRDNMGFFGRNFLSFMLAFLSMKKIFSLFASIHLVKLLR